MLDRFERAAVVSMLSGLLLVGLTSCWLLPGVPLDVPISAGKIGDSLAMSWCARTAEVTSLKVFYAEELVLEVYGNEVLEDRSSLALDDLVDGWRIESGDIAKLRELDGVTRIGIIVTYEDSYSERGSLMAGFRSSDGERFESWPAGKWIWAEGTVSEDPCGMASARG
ncbi:hypothetical protein J2Y69_003598 [Microbacterium resistens]|uniref:Nuclear transport factor 2 family protein n=1 Tax=Microbacterium resistens TaxID=156977 RepID=A0ABU1SHA7_9MICO|nr:hypothetical protein [Microbacterium resistens]MDR6868970.1 hypothetical protein [Microbacterium resistens]